MTIALTIWVGVATMIAAGARKWLKSSWARAIGGGFTWPTWPFLIATSRLLYGRRRRILP